MSQIGKLIKSFSHCQHWCLEQHRPVWIRKSKGNELIRHSWKVVKGTPFGTLEKTMEDNRIFECHTDGKG